MAFLFLLAGSWELRVRIVSRPARHCVVFLAGLRLSPTTVRRSPSGRDVKEIEFRELRFHLAEHSARVPSVGAFGSPEKLSRKPSCTFSVYIIRAPGSAGSPYTATSVAGGKDEPGEQPGLYRTASNDGRTAPASLHLVARLILRVPRKSVKRPVSGNPRCLRFAEGGNGASQLGSRSSSDSRGVSLLPAWSGRYIRGCFYGDAGTHGYLRRCTCHARIPRREFSSG